MPCQTTQTSWQSVSKRQPSLTPGISTCRLFNLSAEDLKYKYEAFIMSRPSGLRAKLQVFNLEVVRQLRKEIQRENQAKSMQAATPSDKVGVRKKGAVADLGGL